MHLKTPVTEEDVIKLRIGDVLYLSGEITTARDRAHQRVLGLDRSDVPVDFNVVYHCGPLAKKNKGWEILSCGPTTSARMNRYTGAMAERFGTRLFIGKGGMNKASAKVFKEKKCAYLAFTGGAGVLAAHSIRGVKAVHWLDLGIPEAVWVLKVEEFGPLVVAMDAHGGSLY
jgi:fumarate hydratase subunit beta